MQLSGQLSGQSVLRLQVGLSLENDVRQSSGQGGYSPDTGRVGNTDDQAFTKCSSSHPFLEMKDDNVVHV